MVNNEPVMSDECAHCRGLCCDDETADVHNEHHCTCGESYDEEEWYNDRMDEGWIEYDPGRYDDPEK